MVTPSERTSGLSLDDLLELAAPPNKVVEEWLLAHLPGGRDSADPLAMTELLDLGYDIGVDLDDDDDCEAVAAWFSRAQTRGLTKYVAADERLAIEWCAA